MANYKQYLISLFSLCLVYLLSVFSVHSENQQPVRYDDNLYELETKLKNSFENNDSAGTVKYLYLLGNEYSHRALYAYAYENFWNALLVAEELNDSVSISKIYEGIGWLYSFYLRNDEAKAYYFKSLELKKKLIQSGKITPNLLISGYLSLTTFHRESGNYDMSKLYIDSCYSVYYDIAPGKRNDVYIKAELAYYYLNVGKNWRAISLLNEIEGWFKEKNPSYLIILYKFLADAYMGDNNYGKSEYYYNEALKYARNSSSHANYMPLIYERLSELYKTQGRYKEAFSTLNEAKKHELFLFDSRSLNNRPLLEISDNYKKEQELRMDLIQQQKIEKLEHSKKVGFYENLILLSAVIFLIIFGFLWRRSVQLKHKADKEISLKQKILEAEKNKELLELKNKELALSALQLVEKDKHLEELKTKILEPKQLPEKAEIRKMFKSLSVNYNQNWKEFEARFIEVNTGFYATLTNKYPNLTQGELKLCALIKLNFSSKEMASLLGSGVESIHTLRHRLRKKLRLTRSDNLTQFLNSLG